MVETVLDASAILALLNGEEGGEAVVDKLRNSAISAVNAAEVATRLVDIGMPMADVRRVFGDLGLNVIGFDTDDAFATAALREGTKSNGLSLGDRACLALARRLEAAAVTADRAWGKLEIGIDVTVIR